MSKDTLLQDKNRLEATLNEILEYQGKTPKNFEIKRQQNVTKQAVEVVLASDWHVGEKVDPDTVNDLNEFNDQVCDQRVQRFFDQVVEHHELSSAQYKIKYMVLALLGDFLSGNIHDELMENSYLLPIEAIQKAQDYLYNGIKFLLKNTKCNITIPCCYGNHGRITEKNRNATGAGNNLETFMYGNLEKLFADEKRVKFLITKAYHNYMKIYDWQTRFHHGHNVKYYGGVSGIYLSMNKAITQWDKGKPAKINVSAHFHQQRDGGNFINNGSLIGYNAYAMSIKADFEEPKQAYFLIEPEAGKTLVAPLLLTDAKSNHRGQGVSANDTRPVQHKQAKHK